MNLIIDVGNTSVKIAVFQDFKIHHKEIVTSKECISSLKKIKVSYPKITRAIISSVAFLEEKHCKWVQEHWETVILKHTLNLPFTNVYATPHTLGVDRIALVAAAVSQFPNKNCLIIDAGTCITYDFKTKEEQYLGGAIAPGIQLRYKSLQAFTANLPLLDPEYPTSFIGDSTEQSIHSGVINGILQEIEGIIRQYCNTYDDLTVILTGGDAHFLSNRLKNSIFATSNFLLEGLNHILDYNSSQ